MVNENPLSRLTGQALTSFERIHDYVQFRFDSQATLSVFNPIETLPASLDFDDLIGVKVASVESGEGSEAITFDTGALIRIDVRDDAFTGPEAMTLDQPGANLVVW